MKILEGYEVLTVVGPFLKKMSKTTEDYIEIYYIGSIRLSTVQEINKLLTEKFPELNTRLDYEINSQYWNGRVKNRKRGGSWKAKIELENSDIESLKISGYIEPATLENLERILGVRWEKLESEQFILTIDWIRGTEIDDLINNVILELTGKSNVVVLSQEAIDNGRSFNNFKIYMKQWEQ